MKLIKNESNYFKSIRLSQNDINLFIVNCQNEYIRLETAPYSKKVSFSLEKGQDDTETEIFDAFKELILKIINVNKKYPYSNDRIVVDENEGFIAIKSDSINPNILKIDYDSAFTNIVLTFYQNPKYGYYNNRIIIDRAGVLFGHFFIAISELLDRLSNFEPKKKNKVMQLISQFTKKSC